MFDLRQSSGRETLLSRDRAAVLAGLAALALLAWLYLVFATPALDPHAGTMAAAMPMPQTHVSGPVELLLLFAMWAVMMVAMMVPSAAPLVLRFARANRLKGGDHVIGSAGVLLLGYLLVWVGFAVLAALAQWGLHRAALLSPMMASGSAVFGGAILVAAGLFQFTPLKRACLAHCRSPLAFLLSHWREGQGGALRMGLTHGAYCVGCCWMLMALLFVAGVMNLLWVAAIAAFVFIERIVPRGDLIGRFTGAALIVAGLALLVA